MIVFYLFLVNVCISSAHLKDDIKKWYDFVSNPTHHCSPNANNEKNTLVMRAYPNGLLDVETEDCFQEKGYSLNYKFDTGKKVKKGALSGTGSIAFGTNSNHGFKTGVCVRTLSPEVQRIDATFENNMIQGRFRVYFKDETTMDGYAKDSKIISPVRYFLYNKLVNITDNKNNYIEKFGSHSFNNDDVNDYIIDMDKGQGVVCSQDGFSNYIHNDCVDTDLLFEGNSCHYKINIPKSTKALKKFRWNRLNDERHYEGDNEFSQCNSDWKEASNAKEELETWLKDLNSLLPDPYWKMQPYSNPIDETNPRVSINVPEWNRSYLNMTLDVKSYTHIYGSELNKNGQLDFKFDPKDSLNQLQQGYVFIASKSGFDSSGVKIEYENNDAFTKKVEGMLNSKLLVVGYTKNGKYHGIVRRFGRLLTDPQSKCNKDVFFGISFIGRYENGVSVGPSWRVLVGGGILYGDIDGEEFTGDNLAYIYPDLETAIVGKFEKGILIEGKEATVTQIRCMNGIYEVQFSKPEGPSFHFSSPSSSSFGDQPTITDPLDKKYVYIKDSNVDHERADQGVFAARDIKEGSIFATYCGYILNKEDYKKFNSEYLDKYNAQGLNNTSDEYYVYMKYHMSMSRCGYTITIPPELGSFYKATLGHKLQHSFNPNAAFNRALDVPRYGACMCITALRDIKKDEEIFANYGYAENTGPPWYRKLFQETYKKSSS